MAKTRAQFELELFNESDGSKFAKQKDKFIAAFSSDEVLPVLIRYVKEGKLLHWRNFLLTDIIELINNNDASYADFFRWALTQQELTYWSVDGLLKTAGAGAYEVLVKLAADELQQTSNRAKAIKSLAAHSSQPFDRQLPVDPGYWKPEQLRIDELMSWQAAGYPHGAGYALPPVHPSLLDPKTALQQLAAKLEEKLKLSRAARQDPAAPSNWLTPAEPVVLAAIQEKWKLPEVYLEFLKNYSPLRVFIDNEEFFQGLDLYGASELIERQDGYSFNAVKNEPITDWPANYLVIADAGGDPYCIDLSDEKAPVYTSMHGGPWEFEEYAGSFLEFLKKLSD